jgi:uncharacterized membrane protein YdcZ (DUF606 family)
MLEIIGWIGCLYLFIKGLEILGSSAHRVRRFESEETRMSVPALLAACFAIAGALLFPFLLRAQASNFSPGATPTSPEPDATAN